ncbi:MAG: type 1 periplasmic binding fold superfamily protein [Saprospiraceae bacterium]|nr:type 1 periplasmic binding fold superfamily protein [Lewinella sp.]
MKNIIKLFTFGILGAGLLSVTACQKDDDDTDVPTDQEVITTVQLDFTPVAGGTTESFVFSDEDGPGGNAPIVDEISLAANTAYDLSVEFIDRSDAANPEFITEEVMEEADAHLVCYEVSIGDVSVTIKDQDVNGNPLGLSSTLQTGAAGTGTFTILLKHEPTKTASDPCSTGETDVEADFVISIN